MMRASLLPAPCFGHSQIGSTVSWTLACRNSRLLQSSNDYRACPLPAHDHPSLGTWEAQMIATRTATSILLAWTFVSVWCLPHRSSADARRPTVRSGDGTMEVTVDPQTNSLASITSYGTLLPSLQGGAGIAGTKVLETFAQSDVALGSLRLSSKVCLLASCRAQHAWVNLTLIPRPSSLRLELAVEGFFPSGSDVRAPWTSPVRLNLTFHQAGRLKLWAPWNRRLCHRWVPFYIFKGT